MARPIRQAGLGTGRSGNEASPSPSVDGAIVLPIAMQPQPDDQTCGPTCLHAVYRYWGDRVSLAEVIETTGHLQSAGRGTLAVILGLHALDRGYRATLYTLNLTMFDPSWFDAQGHASSGSLLAKLQLQNQAKARRDARFDIASGAYTRFLQQGGIIRFCDLTSRLLIGYLRRGAPILTGLSATYLYRCPREFGPKDDYDDIRGEPAGHFVVLHGYDPVHRRVHVADPLDNNPGFESRRYEVSMARLASAITLGVLTYDANLLMIEPGASRVTGGGSR